tara:strand:- start:505 stop:675 length:171 start_codon:yes stop_codon:yes gene_type:complete
MGKINIKHIEKHLFDEKNHKNFWDRKKYPYPLVTVDNVKVEKVINAKLYKKVHGVL